MLRRACLLMSILAGCTWITPDEVAEKRKALDDDNDGLANGVDCNHDFAQEGQLDSDIPYDGYDNDCVDGDIVDLDGDGFPGISFDAWTASRGTLDLHAQWPSDIDPATEVDCDDENADVRPDATETWYDGTASNCGTTNDFDADLDGFVSDAWDSTPAFVTYIAENPTHNLPGGDCLDTDPSWFPGADDAWYDGDDTNCAYDNDFDADLDGYVAVDPTGTQDYWTLFLNQQAQPGYEGLTASPGDCLDQDGPIAGAVNPPGASTCLPSPVAGAGLATAAHVHPTACDEPLDGIDADCAGDDDFDADGDGFTGEAHVAAFDTYVGAWDLDITASSLLDCDDDDPTVHPDALEILADDVDQDCFPAGGDGDIAAAIQFSTIDVVAPGRPSAAYTGNVFTLSLYAEELSRVTPSLHIGVRKYHTFAFNPSAEPKPVPVVDETVHWRPADSEAYVDNIVTVPEGPDLWVLGGDLVDITGTDTRFLAAGALEWLGTGTPGAVPFGVPLGVVKPSTGTASDPFSEVDLYVADDGRKWMIGCTEGELRVGTWESESLSASTAPIRHDTPLCLGGDCVLGDTCAMIDLAGAPAATTCGPEGCDVFDLGVQVGTGQPEGSVRTNHTWGSIAASGIKRHPAWAGGGQTLAMWTADGMFYALPELGGLPKQWLLSENVLTADAIWAGGKLHVLWVAEDGGDRRLRFGIMQPLGSVERVVDLNLESWGGIAPDQVSLAASPTHLMMAVTTDDGVSGQVGWAFLAW